MGVQWTKEQQEVIRLPGQKYPGQCSSGIRKNSSTGRTYFEQDHR